MCWWQGKDSGHQLESWDPMAKYDGVMTKDEGAMTKVEDGSATAHVGGWQQQSTGKGRA